MIEERRKRGKEEGGEEGRERGRERGIERGREEEPEREEEREEDASSRITHILATSVLATLHSKPDHSSLGKDAVQISSAWSISLPFRKIQGALAQHPFLQNRLNFWKG